MSRTTDIRFARSGDGSIAYRTLGDGPIDLVLIMGAFVPIDALTEEPSAVKFFRRLQRFARVTLVNVRGIGLSDPITDASLYPEQHVDDLLTVLDALGVTEVNLLVTEWAAQVAVEFAVREPDRVTSLILYHSFVRSIRGEDYPYGWDREAYDQMEEVIADQTLSATGQVGLIAPSAMGDEEFVAWADRAFRGAATPATVRTFFNFGREVDGRHLLPDIRVPTLVMHRVDNQFVEVGHSRYMAEQIPGAHYVELPGADHVISIGGADQVAEEIEEFLTGARRGRDAERRLATILISDLVGSTERAAELGDAGWRDVIDQHDRKLREIVQQHGGNVVKSTGDGVLAVLEGPGPAIRCAQAIIDRLAEVGLEVRCGIHTGEIEFRDDDIGGLGVHLAARVAGLAGAGEVVVSSAVPPLMIGSEVGFESRGTHELKGVPGSWELFAVAVDEGS